MHQLYLSFLRGLSANWLARIGAGVTTASFVAFSFVELLRATGGITNPYFDLVLFLALPPLFVGGLLLVAWGWWLFRRQQRRLGISEEELLRRRFGEDITRPGRFGSKLMAVVAALTAINLAVLGGGMFQMHEHMQQATFCGTTCHVMKPEWTAYQDSPHRSVPCVECHVGEGMDALVASKVRGMQQMWEHAAGIYHRPIPTPVHTLSPAQETCGRCHAPEYDVGRQLRVKQRFALDEANTPTFSTVELKVGAGDGQRGVIHWHAARQVRVDFEPADERRTQVRWVEVRQGGKVRRFVNQRLAPAGAAGGLPVRRMDCTDCHNRAAHVYQSPEAAVDELIARGAIDSELPYVKAKALDALTRDYPSRAVAAQRIEATLTGYYDHHYPDLPPRKRARIDEAVRALVAVHSRNVHPQMRVEWGAYPSLNGHPAPGQGCFRCHSPDLVDEQGRAPAHECTTCHSILADGSPEPFAFQRALPPTDPERAEYDYLANEYRRSLKLPPAEPAPAAQPAAGP